MPIQFPSASNGPQTAGLKAKHGDEGEQVAFSALLDAESGVASPFAAAQASSRRSIPSLRDGEPDAALAQPSVESPAQNGTSRGFLDLRAPYVDAEASASQASSRSSAAMQSSQNVAGSSSGSNAPSTAGTNAANATASASSNAQASSAAPSSSAQTNAPARSNASANAPAASPNAGAGGSNPSQSSASSSVSSGANTNTTTPPVPASAAASSATVQTQPASPDDATTVQASIVRLLDSGVSLDQIVKAIAQYVTQKLGVDPTQAQSIAQKIAAAITPQGGGGGDPTAQAVAVTGRLDELLDDLAKAQTPDTTTKQNETILDADEAGDTTHTKATTKAPSATDLAQLAAMLASLGTPQPPAAPQSAPASATSGAGATGVQSAAPGVANIASLLDNLRRDFQNARAAIASAGAAASNVPAVVAQNAASADSSTLKSSSPQSAAPQSIATTPSSSGSQTVSTSLDAVANGGNSDALGRALIRAANVDARNTPPPAPAAAISRSDLLAGLATALDRLAAALPAAQAPSAPPVTPAQTSDQATDAPTVTATSPSSSATDASQLAGLTAPQPAAQATQSSSFASHVANENAASDPSEIMSQIVNGISIRKLATDPTITISLTPPQLGDVSVKMTVSNSTVNATIVTASSDVRSAVLSNVPQLDRVLAQAGLKLGSLSVDVSGRGLDQQPDRRPDPGSPQGGKRAGSSSSNTPVADVASVAPSRGPTLLHGVDLTLLNQLV